MTEQSRQGSGAQARPGAIDLAAAGWRDFRGSFARLWPVWLAWAVFSGVAQYLGHQILKPGGAMVLSPELFAYEMASSVGAAVFGGLTLRVFLAPDEPVWRLDRGFFAYVGLVSLASLLTLVAAGLQPTPPTGGAAMEGSDVGLALAIMVLFVVGTWAAIRLIPWPIALLLGNRAVTPAEAWGRMRGVVWPYLGACIVLGGLPFLVSLVFASQYFYHGEIAALILGQPYTTFYRIMGVAVGAG